MAHFQPTVKQAERFFVWLGRFIPVKGPHLAIEAAKKAGVPIVLAGTVDRHVRESVDYFEQVIRPLIDDQPVVFFEHIMFSLKEYQPSLPTTLQSF